MLRTRRAPRVPSRALDSMCCVRAILIQLPIHRALEALRAAGFDGASRPVGIEPDGRERLEFIVGDVPLPPHPEWAQTDDVLVSITELIKSLHDASQTIDLFGDRWSNETADPAGGPAFCHNDVCLEDVVLPDDEAVGSIDFDFAAPGRRVFDLASFARMCIPIGDEVSSAKNGWVPSDRPGRLRLVADSYGLDAAGRSELIDLLAAPIAKGGEIVLRHVEAGEPGFITIWNQMGGLERFDRCRGWWATARTAFEDAMS